MNRRRFEFVAFDIHAIQGSDAFDEEETLLAKRAKRIRKGEWRPVKPGHTAGPSSFDIDAKELARYVRRHVEVAVAAKGNAIEPGASSTRRQELLARGEYLERRGA